MDASEFVRRHHNKEKYDRFIPNRAAMNFDYAHYMIFEGWKKPNKTQNEAYMKRLREAFDFDKTRILEFKSEPPAPIKFGVGSPHYCASASLHQTRPVKRPRHVPKEPEHELDVSDLLDDYCLNLLDWSSRNVVAIALGTTVHLWDASLGLASELVTVDDDAGPVTSVSWAPNGCHIALGLNNSEVQLWDSIANRQVGTLRGCHRARVGSLAWNNQILTTGSMDGQIINHDMRVADHKVVIYKGHKEEVCGLKWSPSGQQLASAGNDKLLHIWDRSMATKWLHRLKDHTDAVKALAWSPFESHLLASGGVGNDHCIKFWKTHTGKCLNSIDTGSPVISLLWSKNGPELLSSDGSTNSQMTLWKYPSMVKTAELMGGHTPNVLYMAQSPDGCTVASAGDEILQFWNVFEPRKEKANEPFAHLSRIR